MCFFNRVKFYTAKMKIDKEFWWLDQQNRNRYSKLIKESVIVTLLIISALFTYFQLRFWYVLEHLSILNIFQNYRVIVRVRCTLSHESAAEVQFDMFTDCTKHASAGTLIHRQKTIYWIFTPIKLSSIYGRKVIGPWWNIKRCLQFRRNSN